MHCLLCHEKIPRLRAWTSKSEFCSEEHAALYKRQTLERLLTSEPETVLAEAPPIEAPAAPPKKPAAIAESTEAVLVASSDSRRRVQQQAERPTREEVDQLWRLADGVGQPGGGKRSPGAAQSSEGPRQSAEEALEALQQMAGRASNGDALDAPPLSELNELEAASLELPADVDLDELEAAANDWDQVDPPELAAEELAGAVETAGEEELDAPSFDPRDLAAATPEDGIEAPELEIPDTAAAASDTSPQKAAAPEIEAPDLAAPDLTAPDVEALELEAADLAAPDLETFELEAPDLTAPDLDTFELDTFELEAPDLEMLDAAAASEAGSPAEASARAADDEATRAASALDLRELGQALSGADAPDLEAPSMELLDGAAAEAAPPAPDMELSAAPQDGSAVAHGKNDSENEASAKVLEFPTQQPAPSSSKAPAGAASAPAASGAERPALGGAASGRSQRGVRLRPAAKLMGLQPTAVAPDAEESQAGWEPALSVADEVLAPLEAAPDIEPLSGTGRMRRGAGFEPCLDALIAAVEPDFESLDAAATESQEASAESMQTGPQEPLAPRDAVVRTPQPESGGGLREEAPEPEALEDRLRAADGH